MFRHLTVTCPTTGTVYPVPAGGSGDPTDGPPPHPQLDPTPNPDPVPAQPDGPKPPWGSDDQFQPDKAWRLIQNLRGEIDELKPKVAKLRELEDADKTEAQKAADRAAEAEQRATRAEAQAARLDAAIRHGLTEEDLDLLDGVPADKVDERAKRLAERLAVTRTDPKPSSRRQGGGNDRPRASVETGRELYEQRHRQPARS